MKLPDTLRLWGILGGLMVVMLLTAGVASASNSWTNSGGDVYHWRDTNLSPSVTNKNADSPLFDVPAAVAEWAVGGVITPAFTSIGGGDIQVEVKRIRGTWLGVASIWIEKDPVDGQWHITAAKVQLNKTYLKSLSPAQWDHVLCQELGHALGLGHDNDNVGCMSSSATLGQAGYTSPSDHDFVHLNTVIYGHSDSTVEPTLEPTPDDDGGNGGCPLQGTQTFPSAGAPANGSPCINFRPQADKSAFTSK